MADLETVNENNKLDDILEKTLNECLGEDDNQINSNIYDDDEDENDEDEGNEGDDEDEENEGDDEDEEDEEDEEGEGNEGNEEDDGECTGEECDKGNEGENEVKEIKNEEDDENVMELTFEQLVEVINDKYFDFLGNVKKIYINHETLGKSVSYDIEYFKEKIESDPNAILTFITDNYLYCLEEIKDKNSDFFVYQKEKTIKKKGNSKNNIKIIKNKLTKVGNKTLLKSVLENLKNDTNSELLNEIIEIFKLLIYEDENVYAFHEDYLEFVNSNFESNKNYNKICNTIENIDLIIGNIEENDIEEAEYKEKMQKMGKESSKDKKKGKKSKNSGPDIGKDFIKGIENTKIAQMAKSISEKINLEDFPILTDPSKLLSTLTNPEEGLGSIGGLLDVVMKEVQSSFKDGGDGNENDLINEAQNIMGKLNGSNLDPMNIMKNMNLDPEKLSKMFNK